MIGVLDFDPCPYGDFNQQDWLVDLGGVIDFFCVSVCFLVIHVSIADLAYNW